MEKSRPDPKLTSQADMDFHLSIAATHNPLVASLLDALSAPLHNLLTTSYAAQPFQIDSGIPDHLLKGERELVELGLPQEALF